MPNLGATIGDVHAILDVILESSEIISIFHSYASDVASFILGGL